MWHGSNHREYFAKVVFHGFCIKWILKVDENFYKTEQFRILVLLD